MTVLRKILFKIKKTGFRGVPLNFRTLSTVAGIVLGVAALTASFNFSETARKEILKSIEGMTNDLVFIRNLSISGKSSKKAKESVSESFHDEDSRIKNLITGKNAELLTESINELDGASPVIKDTFTIMLPHVKRNRFSLLGVNSEFSNIFRIRFFKGRFFYPYEELSNKRLCIISKDTALEIFGREKVIGKYLSLYDTELKIIGIIDDFENTPFIDKTNIVITPYSTFINLTGKSDIPHFLVTRLKKDSDNTLAIAKIETVLMRNRNEKLFKIWDQNHYIEKRKQMARTVEWLVTSISFLILFVASISCSNIMILSVNQRTQEIGIRRAVGATKIDILGMFLFEGFILMTAGGLLGIIGGFFLTSEILKPLPTLISSYKGWQFDFTAFSVIRTLGVLFLIAFISSLIPAWHAAKLDPAQALRQ
ncbi:MAG: ABC transporter permease [Candidatus Aureabacteria bacterium]|nr:ABC transporter permease [Candidatus Auribacterota bacterium]